MIATFGVFFLMAILYRARVIRATPKFVRGMIAVMAGLFAVMLINFVLSLFGFNTGLRDGGALGIGFSIICIVVASLSFILSFNEVEEGVRHGPAPALLLDRGVRHPGQPDLAVPRGASPAELLPGRRLASRNTPTVATAPGPSPHGPGAVLSGGDMVASVSAESFAKAVDRLLNQVSHWEQPRWSAGNPSKADLVHGLVQHIADLGADAESRALAVEYRGSAT